MGLLVAVGGSVAAVAAYNNNAENERQAAAAETKRQKREADEKKSAAEAAAAATEREARAKLVTEIQESVKKMAVGHAKDGLLADAPLKNVDTNCEPVDGSFDDLLSPTTTFKCFVPTKKADGGMYEGFNYHATVNWDSGEYTYGMGEP
ncbi:DUF2510 domain-containing protein [Aeromicrobium senzhongii]|uniref:DUF2510 domain-containing protein n=1 Tax=Aeromicrobium senzhongii TaxID=2663859 RepID=A0ABX6T0U0_9ACTN|nr:DUF2510 domain-containing protein [Aeromicrobium senzhongii]MTB87896.1 DUF2510 domain-containing protein [Aeromicrobium senzhongii]QNL95085.1 DUF2510 domain-containing protein [Aeromicrobium senzhongii]